MSEAVRVRFAPSPTGYLHIGGVRTALFNYLFAKSCGGLFFLRIEDTDRERSKPEFETEILRSMEWLEFICDGSVVRQSERFDHYRETAERLVSEGKAAVSTEKGGRAIVYKTPAERVKFDDLVHGDIEFDTATFEDLVLIKSDGSPAYNFACVVDDHDMQITHVIRGEEWLPSLPLHVMLYKAFGWTDTMPQFAHLPLILKPSGNGKLSKRDGDKLGFPVFPINWNNKETSEIYSGYREAGYFSDAFVNILALLGWNDGTDKEIYTMEELVDAFSLERVGTSGSRFDPDKAKWVNHQYMLMKSDEEIAEEFLKAEGRGQKAEISLKP